MVNLSIRDHDSNSIPIHPSNVVCHFVRLLNGKDCWLVDIRVCSFGAVFIRQLYLHGQNNGMD